MFIFGFHIYQSQILHWLGISQTLIVFLPGYNFVGTKKREKKEGGGGKKQNKKKADFTFK